MSDDLVRRLRSAGHNDAADRIEALEAGLKSAHEQIGILAGRNAELKDVLGALTDDDDCQYDHHGYCQAHGWMTTETRCANARARDMLASQEDSDDDGCTGG